MALAVDKPSREEPTKTRGFMDPLPDEPGPRFGGLTGSSMRAADWQSKHVFMGRKEGAARAAGYGLDPGRADGAATGSLIRRRQCSPGCLGRIPELPGARFAHPP